MSDTELQVVTEALRQAIARIKRMEKLMRPVQPKRIEVIGKYGLEIWSLPIED